MTDQSTSTAPTTLPPGTWQIDPTSTTVTVSAKKLLLWTIPGTLTVSHGSIEIGADGQVAAADVVADAGSYTSKLARRNAEVVGSKLLDAASFPTIAFHADTVVPAATGFQATGTVTIKGRTSPISMIVSDVSTSESTATFRAEATVDRRDVGVDAMPSLIIGNELQLSISASARRAS